jgi:DNA processing protein
MYELRALAALGRLRVSAARWTAARQSCDSEAAAVAELAAPRGRALEPELDADLGWIAASGARLIHCDSAEYPARLRTIRHAPAVLYLRGHAAVLGTRQVAMVGSRAPTAGGRATAREFAFKLGRAGLTITSGLAVGIDAASHQGALAAPAPTIAVLGGGLDTVYPPEHAALAAAILAADGALVSELPPRSPPRRAGFPQRNRLISGLALGVLVIEAVDASGTMHTARHARDQQRPLLAVPGSIRNPQSSGCHSLIRAGARLVRHPADVLEELNIVYQKQTLDLFQRGAPRVPELDKGREILLHALGFDPISFDVLVERTGFLPERVASLLLLLELDGFVESHPGGRFGRAQQAL